MPSPLGRRFFFWSSRPPLSKVILPTASDGGVGSSIPSHPDASRSHGGRLTPGIQCAEDVRSIFRCKHSGFRRLVPLRFVQSEKRKSVHPARGPHACPARHRLPPPLQSVDNRHPPQPSGPLLRREQFRNFRE